MTRNVELPWAHRDDEYVVTLAVYEGEEAEVLDVVDGYGMPCPDLLDRAATDSTLLESAIRVAAEDCLSDRYDADEERGRNRWER